MPATADMGILRSENLAMRETLEELTGKLQIVASENERKAHFLKLIRIAAVLHPLCSSRISLLSMTALVILPLLLLCLNIQLKKEVDKAHALETELNSRREAFEAYPSLLDRVSDLEAELEG